MVYVTVGIRVYITEDNQDVSQDDSMRRTVWEENCNCGDYLVLRGG